MSSETNQFKTLKKSDPDFEKYLMGYFSQTEIARPLNSLNVGTESETVTFEIIEANQIIRPNYLIYWSYLIKLKTFVYFLFPLFFVIVKNSVDERMKDPISLVFTILGGLFIFAGFNIRQDVNDHISGFDRMFKATDPKPISKGWISAGEAKFLSWFLLAIGMLICVPSFLMQKELIRVAGVLILITLAGRLLSKNNFKTKEIGEVAFFLLAGPGVASAFQVALGGGIDTEVLAFGALLGFSVLFLVHIHNFVYLVDSEKFGLENAMIKYGFDRSKKFLIFWWLSFLCLWVVYHVLYASTYMTWFTTSLLIFWSIPTLIKLAEIQSPVGSDVYFVKAMGKKNFHLMVFLFTLEQMVYFFIKQGWGIV